jgi:hypothetical protein
MIKVKEGRRLRTDNCDKRLGIIRVCSRYGARYYKDSLVTPTSRYLGPLRVAFRFRLLVFELQSLEFYTSRLRLVLFYCWQSPLFFRSCSHKTLGMKKPQTR